MIEEGKFSRDEAEDLSVPSPAQEGVDVSRDGVNSKLVTQEVSAITQKNLTDSEPADDDLHKTQEARVVKPFFPLGENIHDIDDVTFWNEYMEHNVIIKIQYFPEIHLQTIPSRLDHNFEGWLRNTLFNLKTAHLESIPKHKLVDFFKALANLFQQSNKDELLQPFLDFAKNEYQSICSTELATDATFLLNYIFSMKEHEKFQRYIGEFITNNDERATQESPKVSIHHENKKEKTRKELANTNKFLNSVKDNIIFVVSPKERNDFAAPQTLEEFIEWISDRCQRTLGLLKAGREIRTSNGKILNPESVINMVDLHQRLKDFTLIRPAQKGESNLNIDSLSREEYAKAVAIATESRFLLRFSSIAGLEADIGFLETFLFDYEEAKYVHKLWLDVMKMIDEQLPPLF